MRRHTPAHLLATAALVTALVPLVAANPAGGLLDQLRTIVEELVGESAIPSVADLLERQGAVRIAAGLEPQTFARSL
ncbi:hypothetical protein [Nonomuraea sp. NPDC050643]|uniref:hypothetical protein n=1 Tax=Nonomuraea sp. NPDC050643 TaxID=3155660 RepID=UPI0033F83A76